MSAYPYPHGYPYHGRPYTRSILPQTYEPHPQYYPNHYVYPPYTHPPYPNTFTYHTYESYPYATSSMLNYERIEKPTYQPGEESLSSIAENINNRLIQVMKEIDPSCELALKATIPSIIKPPIPYNPPLTHQPERHWYSHSRTNPSYSPPPQQSERYISETPPFVQNFNQPILSYEYLPPANDEIQILKDKVDMFIQMAKEDTINLRNEIRSEMKKNLVALREGGLPLDEIETKMLSMSEELMKRMLPIVDNLVTNDHPAMETNRRENDKMERMIDD
ncbi:uncharacterized protein LOC116015987 [Ipomoea triloba]|uniref:uncharacterized protein LOC116015987 n=1 Tax=Ipomoea triloba TaxID=35885 RepID=UPI00125E6A72|nr:uncharacterized protein LOC116015987 [Ipomoea triloba]